MDHRAGLAFIMCGPGSERNPSTSNKPPNSPSLPPVLCFHGSGVDSHYDTWVPLIEEISSYAPVMFYERRGVGASSASDSHPPTLRTAVNDLTGLLQHLRLEPPYILLAHSHGGTFAREFLQLYPEQVAGMVLAETGQETPTKHDEEQYERQALGNKPVSVIHADSLLGKREGTTSEAGLELLRRWAEEDERLKKAQLRLSSNARYVRVDGCGHDVVRDRPGIVSEEVKWVMDNLVPVERLAGLRGLGQYFKARITCLLWRRKR